MAKVPFFGQGLLFWPGSLFLAKVPFSPILDQKTQNDSCESPYPLLYASRFLGLLFTWLLVTLVPFWLYHPRIPTMHLCQPGPSDDCDDDADVVMAQVRMMQGSWKLETVSQHEISISMCWSTKGRPKPCHLLPKQVVPTLFKLSFDHFHFHPTSGLIL